MVSSLFINIPKEDKEKHVKTIYLDIAKELGFPIDVENDGDVTALAGAMDLGEKAVLGIAMGTSEAGGYINEDGNLNGWISELAFVPIDLNKKAARDEWSGDIGCGVKYFSQDSVIKLGEAAGIEFEKGLSPAEKLGVVQKMLEGGDPIAIRIFKDIGIYLGYTLAFYSEFYKINVLLLLGRVTSGEAGKIISEAAAKVIEAEYPELASIRIILPDEKNKRVGQSIAAASLTEI
ncbi:MAG: ROK family protein [Clostridia bacterium]|nr:ROK family protein [Clostridia bacterium]